jgi:hypothetical protein
MSTVHNFHIPVMGTGHSIDTPARVGPFGISSVVSLVDDLLLEKIREYYCTHFQLPYEKIARRAEDGRARRITAYLDTLDDVIRIKMDRMRSLPLDEKNDKSRYFELLPQTSSLKHDYLRFKNLSAGSEKVALENELTDKMVPGAIDVNIMVKLDAKNFNGDKPLSDEFSDALAALRGYANSRIQSSIVFSAGINQNLYSYIAHFQDFYHDTMGEIKKRIILKVSDFRSALTQGKFLARKGLMVSEFRIESGLNCGGHAFPSNGQLLPVLLREIKEKRDQLADQFRPMIEKYYTKMGWTLPQSETCIPKVTVQGGIGTYGEDQRMTQYYGMDGTGWASPFLLVPEATPIDDTTRTLLKNATVSDLFLSDISPLGVPFNSIRNSGSELWSKKRIENGTPGSPCPKGYLVSNTEFTERNICTASSRYQKLKLEQIDGLDIPEPEKEIAREKVYVKGCICDHLGNGALIALGLAEESKSPQAICPGPNIAWFNRFYSLEEMVGHIYGFGECLVPVERPHMFSKEIEMYVDYFEKRIRYGISGSEISELSSMLDNLQSGMAYCKAIALEEHAYPTENLGTVPQAIDQQKARLDQLKKEFVELVSLVA